MTTSTWAQELKQSITTAKGLRAAGLISAGDEWRLEGLSKSYKVRITPYYAGLIKADRSGAIGAQAIPSLEEVDPTLPAWIQALSEDIYGRPQPWHQDAIGDVERLAAPRLTHRYGNRAIMHLSSLCALYCRFCFRKGHLNDDDRTLYDGSLNPAFEYIKNTPSLSEIILTGGDPLSVNDESLGRILDRLDAIDHVRTIRIHSRMVVTLPSRITPELLQLLNRKNRRASVAVVNHFNHPHELSPQALDALQNLAMAGVVLLNQSVLLRGVNDEPQILQKLFQGLYESGVIPFYLHHPDWTPGTFQFRTSLKRGRAIYESLRGVLSGPAMPQYILDIPQGFGKIPINDFYFKQIFTKSDDEYTADIYEIEKPKTLLAQDHKPMKYLDLYRLPL